MIIKKTVEFDAAHMLGNHVGGCQNLHGHTYKMVVGVSGKAEYLIEEGSSKGMIMDFRNLKAILNDLVSQIDHSYICNIQDIFQCRLCKLLESEGKKVFKIEEESTVENMCKLFMKELKEKIPGIHSIEIWETPTSSCYIEASEV